LTLLVVLNIDLIYRARENNRIEKEMKDER